MIVHKLLAKQPAERFVSASQVAHTLEQCLAHLQQPAAVELPSSAECLLREAAGQVVGDRRGRAGQRVAGFGLHPGRPECPSCKVAGLSESSESGRASSNTSRVTRSTGLGESRDLDPATEWTGDDLKPLQQEFDDWHRRSQKLWE